MQEAVFWLVLFQLAFNFQRIVFSGSNRPSFILNTWVHPFEAVVISNSPAALNFANFLFIFAFSECKRSISVDFPPDFMGSVIWGAHAQKSAHTANAQNKFFFMACLALTIVGVG